jgi:uncharacterized membrane protein YhhN
VHGPGLAAPTGAAGGPALTAAALATLALALLVAAGDWFAVASGRRGLEYICKPATMVLLIASALLLHPVSGAEREWFVVALVLGLAGDIFLMLPSDRFVPGLVSFLLGHLAFAAGFALGGLSPLRAAVAAAVLAALCALLLPPVLRGAGAQARRGLVPAVVAYVAVISLMVVFAFASRQPLAVLPAALFFGSDTLIANRRFVASRPWMALTIIVTYQLAQAGFVLWLTL